MIFSRQGGEIFLRETSIGVGSVRKAGGAADPRRRRGPADLSAGSHEVVEVLRSLMFLALSTAFPSRAQTLRPSGLGTAGSRANYSVLSALSVFCVQTRSK
jgi:hypothetical protein